MKYAMMRKTLIEQPRLTDKRRRRHMLISFIRSLFKKNRSENIVETKPQKAYKKRAGTPDFIDYDGMGNQGRFPSIERKRRR